MATLLIALPYVVLLTSHLLNPTRYREFWRSARQKWILTKRVLRYRRYRYDEH